MDAIAYVSKQGSTERYAKLLAEKLSLKAYKLKDAIASLKQGSNVIYLGCVRADSIMDLKKAEKYFDIKLICAVGMSKTGEGIERIRKANAPSIIFSASTILFILCLLLLSFLIR